MNFNPLVYFVVILIAPLAATAEIWTSKDGKTANLDLIEVSGEGDAASGTFRMTNGRTVTLKASDLSTSDAARLAAWKNAAAPATTPATTVESSAFDEILDGNLVKLDGRRLKKYELTTKPTKYYVFYYTASWCGPCQAFSPTLVEFYNKNKNDKFELILISSDDDEDAMEQYAKDKNMPWPQLKLSKVAAFKKKINHGVRGIPSVIVCDLKGEVVSSDGRDLDTLKRLIK